MKHTACSHPATPAGRKACRANHTEHYAILRDMKAAAAKDARDRARREAVCEGCFQYALDCAFENIYDLALETMTADEADAKARDEYLMEAVMYVEEHISSPCPDHRNDNGDWA